MMQICGQADERSSSRSFDTLTAEDRDTHRHEYFEVSNPTYLDDRSMSESWEDINLEDTVYLKQAWNLGLNLIG